MKYVFALAMLCAACDAEGCGSCGPDAHVDGGAAGSDAGSDQDSGADDAGTDEDGGAQ